MTDCHVHRTSTTVGDGSKMKPLGYCRHSKVSTTKKRLICSNRSSVSADGMSWIKLGVVSFWQPVDPRIIADDTAVPHQIRKFSDQFSW